jgi:hypothetical protein
MLPSRSSPPHRSRRQWGSRQAAPALAAASPLDRLHDSCTGLGLTMLYWTDSPHLADWVAGREQAKRTAPDHPDPVSDA